MKKSLFIFDMDGTLIDTGEGIKYALEVFEDRLGLKHFPKEKAHIIVGPPINENIALTHPELDQSRLDEYGRYFNEVYDEVLLYEVKSYDGVSEVFDLIHEKGGIVAIATAKVGRQAIRVLEECKLFDKVDYLRPWSEGEEKTEIVKSVIDKYNLPLDQIIMMGDSHFDGEAANNNNLDFIAIKYGYGFGRSDNEEKFNPKYVANSVAELKEIVAELLDD